MVWVSWVDPQKHGLGHWSTRFYFGSKNKVWIRYFSSWVRSGQKILTRFSMSTHVGI